MDKTKPQPFAALRHPGARADRFDPRRITSGGRLK